MAIVKSSGQRLPANWRKKGETIGRATDEVKKEVNALVAISRKELENVADRYSKASSSFLAAVVGGGLGVGGGAVITAVSGTILALTGPLGLAIGAALGVYLFRGRTARDFERTTARLVDAINVIKKEISALPLDAPQRTKRDLYRLYEELMEQYKDVVADSIQGYRPASKLDSAVRAQIKSAQTLDAA